MRIFHAPAYKLSKAGQEGKFTDKHVLLDTLNTVANNLNVKARGKRFKASVKHFYKTILILGGPRLARFVAQNVHDPDIHTIWMEAATYKEDPHSPQMLAQKPFSS